MGFVVNRVILYAMFFFPSQTLLCSATIGWTIVAVIIGKLSFFFGNHKLLTTFLFSFFLLFATLSSLSFELALSFDKEFNSSLRAEMDSVSVSFSLFNLFVNILNAKYRRIATTEKPAANEPAMTYPRIF